MIQPLGARGPVDRIVSTPSAPVGRRETAELAPAWQPSSDGFHGVIPREAPALEPGADIAAAQDAVSPAEAATPQAAPVAGAAPSSGSAAEGSDGWLLSAAPSASPPAGPPPKGAGIHSSDPTSAPVRGATPEAEAARQHGLGTDPAVGQYRPGEERTAVRVEQQEGVLLARYQPSSPAEKGDWYDPASGMIYDGCSPGPQPYFQRSWDRYMKALDEHLKHPTVDRVVVDVTDLALDATNLTQLKAHIGALPDAYQERIVRVGFGEAGAR